MCRLLAVAQAFTALLHTQPPACLRHCVLFTQIAMKELREKKIPFTIRRYLPDGR